MKTLYVIGSFAVTIAVLLPSCRMALAAAGGALVSYAFVESYKATQAQREEAERVGKSYSNKPAAPASATTTSVKKSKPRYVAVPVKSEKTKGKDVVIYDVEKDEVLPAAYAPPAGKSYAADEVVNVGGKEAVVASSFQGI